MSGIAVYPSDIIPDLPIEIEDVRKTYITRLERGREFRRTNWFKGKKEVRLKYSKITLADISRLYNFFRQMNGALEDFVFVSPTKDEWISEYIGRADSSDEAFELPVKLGDSLAYVKIYKNGALLNKGYEFVEVETGRDNVLISGLTAGDLITCDFYGKIALKMRFQDDRMSKQQFAAMLFSTGVGLVEV